MIVTKQIPLDDWNMMRSLCSMIKYYTKRSDPKFEEALNRYTSLYQEYMHRYKEAEDVKDAA